MQKKQVAVIDIRSQEITAAVGERGVNDTFLIKARKSFTYDGFADGEFFDVGAVKKLLLSAVGEIKTAVKGNIDCVFVGVPGEFCDIIVRDSRISFDKKKKITETDVEAHYDAAFVVQTASKRVINHSAVYYELDDGRRVSDPVGYTSEMLKGKLCFVLCAEYFIKIVEGALKSLGVGKVEFSSSELAQAMYLIEPEIRDRIALLLDIDFISTNLCIVQGDGILYKKTIPYGGGYISAAFTERFDLDFSESEKLKNKVNLSSLSKDGVYEMLSQSSGKYYSVKEVYDTVTDSLDVLCESVSEALDESGCIVPEYVPLSVTGGEILGIRGAKEHIAGRLNTAVSVLAPKVPMMDKPSESSVLSLLDLALNQ